MTRDADRAWEELRDAAIAYAKASDAAHEYAMTMPAQTPYPERLEASNARDARKAEVVEAALVFGKMSGPIDHPADRRPSTRLTTKSPRIAAALSALAPYERAGGRLYYRCASDQSTEAEKLTALEEAEALLAGLASSKKREAGRAITEEDAERAARAGFMARDFGGTWFPPQWHTLSEEDRTNELTVMRAALSTLPASPAPVPRHGIYVASRASVLARGEMWRKLRAEGHPIISTWIDEDGPNDTASLDELWVRIRREVHGAERLVLYVEPDDFPLRGAFVEIGMALDANVPIFVVAPGVEISGRNQRPFGSWIKHPSVTLCADMAQALSPNAAEEEADV